MGKQSHVLHYQPDAKAGPDIQLQDLLRSSFNTMTPEEIRSQYHSTGERLKTLSKEREVLNALIKLRDDGFDVVECDLNIKRLRRQLSRSLGDAKKETIRSLQESMWFDFSKNNLYGRDADAAIATTREMVNNNILKLPFETCVFIATFGSPNKAVTLATLMTQYQNEIQCKKRSYYSHQHRTWYIGPAPDQKFSDYTLLCLLALSSRSTETTTINFGGRVVSAREATPFNSYTSVRLAAHLRRGGGNGTHASPRLHWRRGHQRKLSSGKIVWIRPTLVGDAQRGLVVHDYAA